MQIPKHYGGPRWYNYTLLEQVRSRNLRLAGGKQVISKKPDSHIKKFPFLSYVRYVFLQNNLSSQSKNQVYQLVLQLQNQNSSNV